MRLQNETLRNLLDYIIHNLKHRFRNNYNKTISEILINVVIIQNELYTKNRCFSESKKINKK